ncbi:DNA-binding response regulator [Actinokineospora bangkokensis]|uniref:DNA-binding response regulator n=2 Tax=Actinokineospora bangkokensis TaxID=1193682 RepID=A0A1Q9LQ27_9PSEU|nr:DNA-binding response regulator [Actinokineospora bangkokensis]
MCRVSGTAKVLVVEDTPDISEVIELALTGARLDVLAVDDGHRALAAALDWSPDVVVLDLNIPGPDGFEVCRRLRQFSAAYVLMLTARADEVDKLVGLSVGADDYLTKPFSPRELVARVQAMLRRPRALAGTAPAEPLPATTRDVGPVRLDLDAREVTVSGRPVALTRIEYDLLVALTENTRQVRTRDQLRERVWGGSWLADDHAVDVHMSNLRRKLTAAGATGVIATVRGVGYRVSPGRPA